jgi:hypothetical protein
LEFESLRDAEDVVHDFNGRSFLGERIIVEFAKIGRDEYMAARPYVIMFLFIDFINKV